MVVKSADGTDLRFKNPGRLLLVVIAFIFWGVGFLDLLGHTSAQPDIFGLYSLPFFIVIILYSLSFGIIILLFFNSRVLSRATDVVRYIQNRTWLSLLVFVGFGIALWVILEWDRWARLAGLQFAAFGMVLLAAAILLFSNLNESRGQTWRKVIAYPLIALLIVEVFIQIIAWFGVLPGTHTIGGDFVPYERIYYNAEGFRNGFANRYGWSFPDVNLDDEKKRILVVGGSYVQALQVEPEQQFSALLTEQLNQGQAEAAMQTEIIAIGLPGFGLSPFIFNDILVELPAIIDIDEIVVLFHLGDDFQSPSPSHNSISYKVNDKDKVVVEPGDAQLRHDLTHYYLRGLLSLQPVEIIRSNYLTPKVITGLVRNRTGDGQTNGEPGGNPAYDFSRLRGVVTNNYALTEPGSPSITATEAEIISGGNNFLFTQGGKDGLHEAGIIANGILETAQKIAGANDITIHMVTIPTFPEAFYDEFQAGNWEAQFGDYDLFAPEVALIEIAKELEIPILPMGQYMREEGATVEEIQALYLLDGLGHFSPQGHQYFADAIFSCFFSDAPDSACFE